MSFTYKFGKILEIRENEKEQQAIVYDKAVQRFKEVAEKLYELLKKKEELENHQLNKIQTGMPIQEIRFHQKYLMNLQKEIDHYQNLVIHARHHMQFEEKRLIDKNIEVKKFEKIKDKEYEKYLQHIAVEDNKIMDEISTQIVAREK
ncbi:flagellar export protein FliJ [Pallidibacillus pasinlerensis]|uniref:Flagellar FliJ protein n=1 Tax=Pallidibacillus pasinlerensis TaxID=2703818 RepID=A0ABX0A863_9BACI|nr:flagellar export protein FliJ [Pallidibacillus pasinlerensis]NCU18239.1 flagellar biosynthesis chaperone FliJ [Pallidibacillus pasinlerensis]